MEKWAEERNGCPQCVADALPFARWSLCLPLIGGDKDLDVKEVGPEEYRMSIQLVHPKEGGPGPQANWRVGI